jgi:hypothetical protein
VPSSRTGLLALTCALAATLSLIGALTGVDSDSVLGRLVTLHVAQLKRG